MEENLNELIKLFYSDKIELDKYKKSTDDYNKDIKSALIELGIDEFESDNGLIAKLIKQKRESFDEEKLINKLKELNVKKPIKTIEIIDYEVLEDIIYNNELDATKISDCKQCKEVLTLKVSKKKSN